MAATGTGIAAYAAQFLNGPGYEWGRPNVGPLAEFRWALEAGGTADEIYTRVMEWARRDFERAEQAFLELRLLNSTTRLEPCSHDRAVP